MTSIQKAQLEFLNETVAFYNSGNLCMNAKGICLYHIPGKAGCAIGRHIPDISLRKEFDALDSSGVDNPFVFNKLPEALKELGVRFLKEVQFLHDNDKCWDEKGLSNHGESQVSGIKVMFGLTDK